jgi:signal transduction histidine kinase
LLYGGVFAAESVVFVLMRDIFAADYGGGQRFAFLMSPIVIALPFLLIRSSLFQGLFLLALEFAYVAVVFGAGNYIELAYGGDFSQRYPYLLCVSVTALLSLPLIPLILRMLRRLLAIWPEDGTPIWHFIWVIPALFGLLCLMGGNVFMGEGVITIAFIWGRVILGAGTVFTCLLLARTLRREAERAAEWENARMIERLLEVQREQYARIAQQDEEIRSARHDLRHQLAALGGYLDSGDLDGALRYCDALLEAIPDSAEGGREA